jgi:type II secretory pathway component GspD/PulD (secretin)
MSAEGRRITPESSTSEGTPSSVTWRSAPRSGDVLASERTARADVYQISVVPAAAHMVVRRYPEAIENVRELARQLGVDGWYTGDQTHYAQVAKFRKPSEY